MTEPATMKIFLQRCAVDLRVGVRDHEKLKPQKIIVTVEAEAALKNPFRDKASADLSTVIDYNLIHNFISKVLPKQEHIPLLETIAQQIVDHCFTDPRINNARVRLEKPGIYPDTESVGVEMVLSRDAHGIMGA